MQNAPYEKLISLKRFRIKLHTNKPHPTYPLITVINVMWLRNAPHASTKATFHASDNLKMAIHPHLFHASHHETITPRLSKTTFPDPLQSSQVECPIRCYPSCKYLIKPKLATCYLAPPYTASVFQIHSATPEKVYQSPLQRAYRSGTLVSGIRRAVIMRKQTFSYSTSANLVSTRSIAIYS